MPTQLITASQTWTCPNGVSSVNLLLWGAGGGGTPGFAGGGSNNGGSGGGSGAFGNFTVPVTPGTQYYINIDSASNPSAGGTFFGPDSNPANALAFASGGFTGVGNYPPSAGPLQGGPLPGGPYLNSGSAGSAGGVGVTVASGSPAGGGGGGGGVSANGTAGTAGADASAGTRGAGGAGGTGGAYNGGAGGDGITVAGNNCGAGGGGAGFYPGNPGTGATPGTGGAGAALLTFIPLSILPTPANTTATVSRTGAVINIHLKPDWPMGQEHGDRMVNSLTWTHIALIPLGTDVRDGYAGAETNSGAGDTLQIPDSTGTDFLVIFITRINIGQATDMKLAYLDRQTPNWPTEAL